MEDNLRREESGQYASKPGGRSLVLWNGEASSHACLRGFRSEIPKVQRGFDTLGNEEGPGDVRHRRGIESYG